DTNTTDLSLTSLDTGYTNSVENTAISCFVGQLGLLIFAGICMGICLCGLGGNGMVVWFLGFNMKKNPFTVYILNLAVADFSVLLLSFLIILVNFCVQGICFHDENAIFAFYIGVDVPYYFFHLTSLGILTAICTERCISVL
ncbi:MRGRD protein, partial [Nothocercus julius]|nr:MRGRD protein [Nothocercus julius]